jgi:hypothetical protein
MQAICIAAPQASPSLALHFRTRENDLTFDGSDLNEKNW